METLNTRDIMVRKPFKRALPYGYKSAGEAYGRLMRNEPVDDLQCQIITQADFIREFEPTSHAINDPKFYPDIVHENPETHETYTEYVDRCSFAFQRIITIKQLTHLCGNAIQFELYSKKFGKKPDSEANNEKKQSVFYEFRKGWAIKDMEIAWYEAAKSVKITGDTAFVGYMNKGKFGWKVFSYKNGDVLYPHFDSITGELILFARGYTDMDEQGNTLTWWLEVWDDEFLYRFKKSNTGMEKAKVIIKKLFGLESYTLVSQQRHGFPFIPIAYHRDDEGACWTNSQDTIEEYELAFSRLSQNSAAYGFPIWYFKGDGIDVGGDPTKGTVKTITISDKDGEVGAIAGQDASTSFSTQLDKLYKMIYEQSFACIPPEVKSGDLPGVAVKLLFSPAFENAMKDAQEFNKFVDKMQKIYAFGYGIEIEMMIDFMELDVYSYIKPYIHLNTQELVNNLATSVQNGFLSRQTASDVIEEYATADEWDKILREKKEEQQMDLLMEEAQAEISNSNKPATSEDAA